MPKLRKQKYKTKYAAYGNWCGPGHTAGQYKNTDKLTKADRNVPAIGPLDQACKEHDIDLHDAETNQEVEVANQKFIHAAGKTGYSGQLFGKLVEKWGPKEPHHNPINQMAGMNPAIDLYYRKRKNDPDEERPRKLPQPVDHLDAGIGTSPVLRVGQRAPDAGANQQTDRVAGATIATNSGASTNMQGETPVDHLPTLKYQIFKPVEQVYMKWRKQHAWTTAAGATSTAVKHDTFRLTSIYDIQTVYGFVDPVIPAKDTADATVNTPHMRAYWMSFYNYWTVTKVHYKIKVWVQTKDISGELYAYVYKHGQQHPPIRDYLTDTYIKHEVRKHHPDMEYKKFKTMPTSSVTSSYFDHGCEFVGSYVPGDIQTSIAEDAFSETWHKDTEVPSHRELLTIMIHRSDRASDVAYAGGYTIDMCFEVQLKDLKVQQQYITNDSAIPAIAGYAANAN